MKVPVVRRPEYTIYLENFLGATFAHCDVKTWTPAIAKRLKADGDAVYGLHGGPLFALNEPAGDEKHAHFLRMLGFVKFEEVPTEAGIQYVYKR